MKWCWFTIIFLILEVHICAFSQSPDSTKTGIQYLDKIDIDGDTLPHISIKEIQIVPPWRFKNVRQKRRYSRLVVNIKKTLPYARLAKNRLNEISAALDTIKAEKDRKEFLKKSEKILFNEFEKPLRKLTFSQGRMLIKLIDRETGDTSYKLIKDLKGGFSAFMWQSVARIFGSNLKSEFDRKGDDAMIEHIILMIDNGVL